MKISNHILKHYLKNVLFINGTAYAGKSTMVKLLADKYDLVHCGENYKCAPDELLNPQQYPSLCYFQTMKGWQEFISRTPEAYYDWIMGCTRELIEFEIIYLIRASQYQKVVVDTNLPLDILREIADYNQVAIMICSPSMSVECFFERDDADKVFLREQIMKAKNPKEAMAHYRKILEYGAHKTYEAMKDSEFFTLTRTDVVNDTKQETADILAKHFGLE